MAEDSDRYHRQALLPGFGSFGQHRLSRSTALILGCGALGSVAADLLARAGIGHLVIVDRDFVELSNLQRQVLYDEQDAIDMLPKAEAAKRRIEAVNSSIRVTAIVDDINNSNIEKIGEGADVIIDGLDNFETRYLANDLAVKKTVPYVYGAAVGTTGMAFTILPRSDGQSPWESHSQGNLATACLRCLFEEMPAPGTTPTCDTVGVISAAVGMVANVQVAEALKILTGNFHKVNRSLLNFDVWENDILQLNADASFQSNNCPCCRHRSFDFLSGLEGSSTVSLCGRNAVQLRHKQGGADLDLESIADRMSVDADIVTNDFMLRMTVRQHDSEYEISLFKDGRAIIKGTDDAATARSVYSKFIGA